MKKTASNATIFTMVVFLTVAAARGQGNDAGRDSLFYRNFVQHSDGSFCKHQPPEATFTVFLNGDPGTILTDEAPRWVAGTDPNIDGKGTFGVELANFPSVRVGDTVTVRFTCNATGEQGELTEVIPEIPWFRFPQILRLVPAAIPRAPDGLELEKRPGGSRVLRWHARNGERYAIYRRTLGDTAFSGVDRRVYRLLGVGAFAGVYEDSTARPDRAYGYVLYAISAGGRYSSHSHEVNEIVAGSDLDPGWISRLPRLAWVWGSKHPDEDGWPVEGQTVVWRAHVRNWANVDVDSVGYRWTLDGEVLAQGAVSIPAGATASVDLPWAWTFERHVLGFEIDPDNRVAEEEEGNNRLSVFTDAISVGFYVEQSVYEYFHRYQRELRVHANSWEDWAQRHVRRWNRMFAQAIYPETPDGVLDRIRIDTIAVVPDGALPLAGGLPTNNPNLNDRTVDLQWGFPASLLQGDFYRDHRHATDANPFYFEGSLLHELGHARYLIDLYGFDVHDDGNGNTVAVRESGQLIAGTPYLPFVSGDALHLTPYRGLMNGQYTFIDRYSAAALNLIAHHRATYGNCNAPGNIGVFMQDLPAHNVVHLEDQEGRELAGALVWVYRAAGKPGEWYGKYFDDEPDLLLQADATGRVDLGRCPFAADGRIVHTYGKANGVILVRVQDGERVGYVFLESTDFNLAYWRGDSLTAEYEVTVNLVGGPSSVAEQLGPEPARFAVGRGHPNPFNSSSAVDYFLPAAGQVTAELFDVRGRRVRVLVRGMRTRGRHRIRWHGRDKRGTPVPSGVYILRVRWKSHTVARRMVLVR